MILTMKFVQNLRDADLGRDFDENESDSQVEVKDARLGDLRYLRE